jgi:uncharacterized membrane protein
LTLAWIVLNVTIWRFDAYPFGLLTLIVSLEAIFLSTFALLSQNREAARSDTRSEIDFETNVLSEVWLEALADNLGIDVGRVYATAQDRIEKAKARQSDNGSRASSPGLVSQRAGRSGRASRDWAKCPRPPVLAAWGTSLLTLCLVSSRRTATS